MSHRLLSTQSLLRLSLALGLVAGLAACATGPDVRADYDKSANFSSYKSFAFVSPLGTDRSGYQSIVSQHLKAATQRELEARGFKLDAAKPDLLVNFNATLNDKTRVTTTPVPTMGIGYYGYRAGMYSTWPLYRDETTVTQYKEGTLNIDVIDAARKQMVWEAVVSDSVTAKDVEQVKPGIDAAIAAAFAKFPLPAPAPAAAPAK
ncbi:DUF4136 domain-containing protein [Paucibacter sp. KBW04]|uniref:DUF4136 domain-containing protein n=1 Tax=Paucibacter sp. KBW04 TaxID=2153361 RepID=UPI000F56D9FA|nr:DUF4136 domain-containing protein [Paucibacter sp. KBW04]RQO58633.1 DUF4136 domain-containing protein [Paucibacter sp. KBW04]